MRRWTEWYLAEKKYAQTGLGKDWVLRKLVINHENKDIAIVACGHAMSSGSLRSLLLSSELANETTLEGFEEILRCMYAASLVNNVVCVGEGIAALKMAERPLERNTPLLKHLLDSWPIYPYRTILYKRYVGVSRHLIEGA